MNCSIKVKAKHLGPGLGIPLTPSTFAWYVRHFAAERLITVKTRELLLKYDGGSKLIFLARPIHPFP